jgi:hypothetical protein
MPKRLCIPFVPHPDRLGRNVVYVGPGSKWENFIKEAGTIKMQQDHTGKTIAGWHDASHEDCVKLFVGCLRDGTEHSANVHRAIREELKGKDLACTCPLDQACHADELLLVANKED